MACLQGLNCVFMKSMSICSRKMLYNWQHNTDHDNHSKEAFISYNLQGGNLKICHKEILKRDLCSLNCLHTNYCYRLSCNRDHACLIGKIESNFTFYISDKTSFSISSSSNRLIQSIIVHCTQHHCRLYKAIKIICIARITVCKRHTVHGIHGTWLC